MQDWGFSFDLLVLSWYAFSGILQGKVGMESYFREDGTLSIRLEETVFVKRGEVSIIEWCTRSSLPAYYLPLFTILVSVVNRIEKFHRNFLWKGMEISLGRYGGRVQVSFGGLGYGVNPYC